MQTQTFSNLRENINKQDYQHSNIFPKLIFKNSYRIKQQEEKSFILSVDNYYQDSVLAVRIRTLDQVTAELISYPKKLFQ